MTHPRDPHYGYDPAASGAPGYPADPESSDERPERAEADRYPEEGHYPPPGGWSIGDDLPLPPPRRNTNRMVLWILRLIVIVVVAIAAYLTLSQPDSQSSTLGRLASPTRPTRPPDSPSGTDSISGLSEIDLCGDQSDPEQVATTYVAAALTGLQLAQNVCVYQHLVPTAVTQKLSGQLFVPVDGGSGTGSKEVYRFTSAAGSLTADVTVTREPDGRYWVTNVSVG